MLVKVKTEEEIQATKKIEIYFGKGRTASGPNAYILVVFDRSGPFSGVGDALQGFCPDCKEVVVRRPVPTREDPNPTATFCEACKRPIPIRKIVDWIYYKTTTEALAGKLEKIFNQLRGDADIVIKYHKKDIRYSPQDFDQSQLFAARASLETAEYRLKRIMDDLKRGTSPKVLFEAFLRA